MRLMSSGKAQLVTVTAIGGSAVTVVRATFSSGARITCSRTDAPVVVEVRAARTSAVAICISAEKLAPTSAE